MWRVHSVAIGHSDISPQLAHQQEDYHGTFTSTSGGPFAVVAFGNQVTESACRHGSLSPSWIAQPLAMTLSGNLMQVHSLWKTQLRVVVVICAICRSGFGGLCTSFA